MQSFWFYAFLVLYAANFITVALIFLQHWKEVWKNWFAYILLILAPFSLLIVLGYMVHQERRAMNAPFPYEAEAEEAQD